LREGKKIAIVKTSHFKKLISECMDINRKNIYHQEGKLIKDLAVKDKINEVFKNHPAYGHRRLALELGMNKKRILRIMHKFNLKPPRLWYRKRFLTKANLAFKDQFTNLLENIDLGNYRPGDIWSSDLTYIKFQGRFLYLAIIKDVVSKEVVGFNLSTRHDSDLVLKTLREALLKTNRSPLIFHSDRGSEYLSEKCITLLRKMGIKISVSDPGSPWQNGWSESFFSSFKTESGDFNRFENLGELVEYVYGYLNYYNNDRIQIKLKMPPNQFRQKVLDNGLEKRGT
jgi:transposase InsO family protein